MPTFLFSQSQRCIQVVEAEDADEAEEKLDPNGWDAVGFYDDVELEEIDGEEVAG